MVGDVHPYVEKIALIKWINKEFGYQLLPRDLDGSKPALDVHEIDWHLIYSTVFNDPDLRTKARAHYDYFRRKGIFSAIYELANEPEPEPDRPVKVEIPEQEADERGGQ